MSVIGDGVEILGLVNKGANVDLYVKLGKYIDEVQSLYVQRDKLEAENKELKEQLRFKGSLVRVHGALYAEGDDEPICSCCAEVDRRLVHVLIAGRALPVCPSCKTTYADAERRSAKGSNAVAIPMIF